MYVDGGFSSVVSKIQVEVVIFLENPSFVSKMMCFFLGVFLSQKSIV